jgi:hypothetical protein
MMIYKLYELNDTELRNFYIKLSDEIMDIIGDEHESLEDARAAFNYFRKSDIRDYRKTMDKILKDISPEGITLNWKDLRWLDHKRIKQCSVCQSFYIGYDEKNRTKYCYLDPYVRYSKTSKRYFKSSNKSVCYMINQTSRRRAARKGELAYIR